MPNLPSTLTIMFSDIAGSSQLYENLGDAVNVAARVAEQTKADQILTTGTTFTLDILGSGRRSSSRRVDRTRTKG